MSNTHKHQKKVARCRKCIMPDSLPGSDFDEAGVCAWCRSGFPNYMPAGEDALLELVDRHTHGHGAADCLVGVSGGKDSSYALYQMVRKFGRRAEALTYVHDGTTEFAVQNAKKVCESLGVKHHIVSLPNHLHLKTCRKFFTAWSFSGDPLAAAMTCVGCKHLHIMATRLAHKRRIPLAIWAACPLEVPPFIPTQPQKDDARENAGNAGAVALAITLMKSMLSSRRFCSTFLRHCPTCVAGCLSFNPEGAFLRKRYPSVKQLQFFEYCSWHPTSILQTLSAETGWSVPSSIKSDWHADCLFNVFKEYMFQKMFYASYTDAFLSNQIRHGVITREVGYARLLESKRYFAQELPKALDRFDMNRLNSRIDLSCFDVDP